MVQINIFYEAEVKWIDTARRRAVELCRARREKGVTIEDILAVCPRPNGVSRKANAKVFKNDVFRAIGYTRARRPVANAHVLRLWTLNDAYFPADEDA